MSAIAPPLQITWQIPPDDFLIPTVPVENSEQDPLASALRQAIWHHPERGNQALMGSNFSICATVNGKTFCKAPDWMYVQPVEPRPRRSYTPYAEGPIPRIVMEFVSDNKRGEYDRTLTPHKIGRWAFYERILGVPYYVIFDPEAVRLEVYRLDEQGQYQLDPVSDAGSQLCLGGREIHWIDSMGLYLGLWYGTREERKGYWLRWWDATGRLLLWPEEIAELERRRADLERQRATTAEQEAEAERQRAELAEQEAEAERQRAELAEQEAETERQRAEQEVEAERQRALSAEQEAEAERQRALSAEQEAQAERQRALAAEQEAERLRRFLRDRGLDTNPGGGDGSGDGRDDRGNPPPA